MRKKPLHTEEIESYLSGELAPEHIAEFEKRLREEEELEAQLEATKKVIEGIEGRAFKEMLKGFHKKHFGNRDTSSKDPS